MKKIKRIIAFILMIGIFLSSFNIKVHAVNSEQEFFDYLVTINMPKFSKKEQRLANYQTYKEYGQIVYGSPWGDRKGNEYRYLGYNETDQPFTNDRFGADNVTGTPPEQFNYIKQANAPGSWSIAKTSEQTKYMKDSTLSGNGASDLGFTLQWIANKFGGSPEEYGMFLSPATWKEDGTVKLQHKASSGKVWYITERVDAMVGRGSIVTGTLLTPADTYYIRRDEKQVKIPATVTASAIMSGGATVGDILEIKATSLGASDTKKGLATVSKTSDFVATRANYPVGTHTITLNGSVSLSTIFNDRDSSNVSKTITLIVEPEGDDPYVITGVIPDPAEKKFENEDIEVTLTVSGELKNYTKTDNIKEWIFYAREKEVTTALEKKIYTKTLAPETTFKFTIPKEKIKDDNYKQYYTVRARVYFREKVNGKDYLDEPAESVVVVYKNEPPISSQNPGTPPTSGNIPPTTEIDGPTIVYAGRTVSYMAKSHDEDGHIESAKFYSSIPPFQETIEKERYSFSKAFSIDNVGDVRVEHRVEDDKGASGSDFLIVEVLPPKPTAELKISGKLKENRIVIMNNISTSYGSPMNEDKTKITIKPYGDGATNNIIKIDSGEELIKNYIFKDRGIYEVTIYVENMIGNSDSKSYYMNIHPDVPPVADYGAVSKIYRDKNDNNYGKIEVTDLSYSPDGDEIVERIWTITYNSNNNKDKDGFPNYNDDASFKVLDSELELLQEKIIINSGFNYIIEKIADDILTIKVNQVGNYLVELTVREGEEYGLEGNTNYKHKLEKTITILNREPFVDFEP